MDSTNLPIGCLCTPKVSCCSSRFRGRRSPISCRLRLSNLTKRCSYKSNTIQKFVIGEKWVYVEEAKCIFLTWKMCRWKTRDRRKPPTNGRHLDLKSKTPRWKSWWWVEMLISEPKSPKYFIDWNDVSKGNQSYLSGVYFTQCHGFLQPISYYVTFKGSWRKQMEFFTPAFCGLLPKMYTWKRVLHYNQTRFAQNISKKGFFLLHFSESIHNRHCTINDRWWKIR